MSDRVLPIAKLPKWAQAHIAQIEGRARRAEARLAEIASPPTETAGSVVVSDYSHAFTLDDRNHVDFYVADGVRITAKLDGEFLDIMGQRPLMLAMRAANVVSCRSGRGKGDEY